MTDLSRRKAVFNPFVEASNRHKVTINDLVPANVRYLIASDESMSGSQIRAGSFVAVRLGSPVIDGNIYLVRFRGEILLRKLMRISGRFALEPTNPAWQREFPDTEDEVQVLGSVEWSFFFHCHITSEMEYVIRNLIHNDYQDI